MVVSRDAIRDWLSERVSQLTTLELTRISHERPLADFGLSSRQAITLASELQAWLQRELPMSLVYEYPTIAALSAHLASGSQLSTPPASPSAPVLEGSSLHEPIAIVGIGCRVPGADSPQAFWDLLRRGADAIGPVPVDRFDVNQYYSSDPGAPGKLATKHGGFISQIGGLDLDFFGISEHEATRMDPQQRLLIEVTWEALEDAGFRPRRLSNASTGMFVGIASGDYGHNLLESGCELDGYSLIGNAFSIAANRISYLFDLRGPSLAVDTACSSSLVAVHLACDALRRGDCDLALAGGVNLILSPVIGIGQSKAGVLSPDGRCKTFSADADGYVRSEGAGMVVLKRLDAALRDRDRVLAVIRGSAVNCDGRTNGILAPSRTAQIELLRTALRRAGVAPSEIGYVESHGSATAIGDEIEASALGSVLGAGRSHDEPCAVGSVKSNIGHLEAAAGIAGLIKVVLCLEHRALPKSLHSDRLNPEIPFPRLGLRVVQELEPWPVNGGRAIAGVSSFGFGGSNAHVVLEAPPPSAAIGTEQGARKARVLPLSAYSPAALGEVVAGYRAMLEEPVDLAAVCVATAVGRTHHAHRVAPTFETQAELRDKLRQLASRASSSRSRQPPRMVFVFPGQGSQWVGMGRSLLASEPVFAEAIVACQRAFTPYVDWNLSDVLQSDELGNRLNEIDVVQPTLFALEVALAALWSSWGVTPDAVLGHSMGEVAAAHVAGVLSLDAAALVICRRSQAMKRLRGRGGMALVALSLEETARALEPYAQVLAPAASNGPLATVVSGDASALEELLRELRERSVFCRSIQVDVASHSPQLDVLEDELRETLAPLTPRGGRIALYSSVTADLLAGERMDADYFWRNLRQPVLFMQAARRLAATGHDCFVELSPHPILTSSLGECFETDPSIVITGSLRRGESDIMPEALATLYERGCEIDWPRVYQGRTARVRLPPYPWQRQRCLISSRAGVAAQAGLDVPGTLPCIRDHRAYHRALAPAAFMLDLALRELNRSEAAEYALADVLVSRPLSLDESEVRRVRVSVRAGCAAADCEQVVLESTAEGEDGVWLEHLTATRTRLAPRPTNVDLSALRARCSAPLAAEQLYGYLAACNLHYGPAMRTVLAVHCGEREIIAELAAARGPDAAHSWLAPDVVDGAMQSIAALHASRAGSATGTFLGFGYRRVDVYARCQAGILAHVTYREDPALDGETLTCDVQLLDASGQVLAVFDEVCLKRAADEVRAHELKFFRLEYVSRSLPPAAATTSRGVVLMGDSTPAAAALGAALERTQVVVQLVPWPASRSELGEEALRAFRQAEHVICLEPPGEQFLSLIGALAATDDSGWNVELMLVSGDPALPPLLRALEQENPDWAGHVRAIEIDSKDLSAHELARHVASELECVEDLFKVSYQRGERLAPIAVAFEPPPNDPPLRPRGVYWIAGGQGGLGHAIAMLLAREYEARILITGRRQELDPEFYADIAAAGGELLYVQADVSDVRLMRRARDLALQRFGSLHGAIHAAGVLDDALLAHTELERTRAIVLPKRTGAQVLAEVTASESLDFIALFSSLAALVTVPGQGVYAGANACLDQFAHAAQGGRTRVVSINWGPWAERGMVADEAHQRLFAAAGLHAFAPEEGARAFMLALASAGPQIIVTGLRRSSAFVEQFNLRHIADDTAAVAPAARGHEQSVMDFVRSEVARTLRRSPADIDSATRFDRLGVDSLMAVALTRRIESHFGLRVPRTLLFDQRTVSGVSVYIEALLGSEAAQAPERVALDDKPSLVRFAEPETDGVAAYVVNHPEAASALRLTRVLLPELGAHDVEISVHATGVNFIDVLAARGAHPVLGDSQFVLGHEVAGFVTRVGSAVEELRAGDRVMAITPFGGYAHRVSTPAASVVRLSAALSFVDAAALLVSASTAVGCLERQARVSPGERVLIQAAAGATGSACVQLALHLGATVFGTASTTRKLDHLERLGVQHPINYRERDFREAVRAELGEQGLDVVIDSLSGAAISAGLELLAPGGRFVEIGGAGITEPPALDPRELFLQSRSFSTFNIGALARNPKLLRSLMARALELIEQGVFRPSVGEVFSFEDAPLALDKLSRRENVGKYVLVAAEV